MVAIKAINKTKQSIYSLQYLYSEVYSLRVLNHPNTVELLAVIDNEGTLLIVREYLCGGDLFTHLDAKGRLGSLRHVPPIPPGEW